jgi:hypothetical protein
MRDFKRVACSTCHGSGEPCPECGTPREPVGELAEVIGIRDFAARRNAQYAERVRDALYAAASARKGRS